METKTKVGRKKVYIEERKQLNIRLPISKYDELISLAKEGDLTLPELLNKVIDYGIQVFKMKI